MFKCVSIYQVTLSINSALSRKVLHYLSSKRFMNVKGNNLDPILQYIHRALSTYDKVQFKHLATSISSTDTVSV